ncbi:MAG: hypothetical protein ACOVQ2_10310 [Flavobacterium sp.]
MAYLKYIQYFYLVVAIIMIVDGINNYSNNKDIIMNVLIAVMAIFMFFFRRHFSNKYSKK